MSSEALVRDLRARLDGPVELDRSLARLTTYRLGGPARVYVEPAHDRDVEALGRALRAAPSIEVLTLGRGSNLVVSDDGWPGIVVRLGASFSWISPAGENGAPGLIAGAATPLPTLANWGARRGLEGLEFLVAIPGSVGGAVRMNAGAHGGAVADRLRSVRVVDLDEPELAELRVDELDLDYRRSNLTARQVVLDARFALVQADEDDIKRRLESHRRHRARTQPGAAQNAGSVFKNPPGDSAGRLVEAAGLKGLTVGGASVAELHANFFLASSTATAQDVYDLVREVRDKVLDAFGVELEPEISFVGSFHDRRESRTGASRL
ncbi:UDP-N-acetylmuramate dehydrogenase [soil metagenome]